MGGQETAQLIEWWHYHCVKFYLCQQWNRQASCPSSVPSKFCLSVCLHYCSLDRFIWPCTAWSNAKIKHVVNPKSYQSAQAQIYKIHHIMFGIVDSIILLFWTTWSITSFMFIFLWISKYSLMKYFAEFLCIAYILSPFNSSKASLTYFWPRISNSCWFGLILWFNYFHIKVSIHLGSGQSKFCRSTLLLLLQAPYQASHPYPSHALNTHLGKTPILDWSWWGLEHRLLGSVQWRLLLSIGAM